MNIKEAFKKSIELNLKWFMVFIDVMIFIALWLSVIKIIHESLTLRRVEYLTFYLLIIVSIKLTKLEKWLKK